MPATIRRHRRIISTSKHQQIGRALLFFNYLMTLFLYSVSMILMEERRKVRRIRRWYVRPINVYRPSRSEYYLLVNDFYSLNESEGHREYFRMDEFRLRDLLRRVWFKLQHQPTHAWPIGPALRLSLTIKYLASGDSLKNTAKSYRIGYPTARKIVYETCDVLWQVLQPEFLRKPTEDEWKKISKRFWDRWHFPLCLGAIDGKHVVIKKPPKAGSGFFNYKMDHSIVLMAVTDADYSFIYVDIGAYGRSGDGGTFARCSFGEALNDETTNLLALPGYHRLPGSDVVAPHVFVADDAFPLGMHILKPFGGKYRSRDERIFDKRLSSARVVVENGFGIMAARWRILHQPIACFPENAERIVKAITVLHNLLMKTDSDVPTSTKRYVPPTMLDYVDEETGTLRRGSWRDDVPADAGLQALETCRNRSVIGTEVRERFKDYFKTHEGRVPWQDGLYLMDINNDE